MSMVLERLRASVKRADKMDLPHRAEVYARSGDLRLLLELAECAVKQRGARQKLQAAVVGCCDGPVVRRLIDDRDNTVDATEAIAAKLTEEEGKP